MDGGSGQLITPEAVVLQLAHAGPGTRIAARGLDLLVQFGLLLVLLVADGIASGGHSGGVVLVVIALVGYFLVIFGYPMIMEARWRGRTLGKAAFGLRVVTRQGAPIHFRHAAIRSALFVVDGLLLGPVIGVLCLLITHDTVRVGDLAAGTIVIRERSGAAPISPVEFNVPTGCEEFVAALDVSGLSAQDYALVRGFLLRAAHFAPGVRYELAVELANPVAGKVRQSPAMHPELFLQCVATAWQLRSTGPAAGPWVAAPPMGHFPSAASRPPGTDAAPASGWGPPVAAPPRDPLPTERGFAPPT